MKEKTRKITLIVLICITMLGSLITLAAFSIFKTSDVFKEAIDQSIEQAYEKSDGSQSLEQLKETSEKGMAMMQRLAAMTIFLQVIMLISVIKGPTKSRIALIYLSFLNLILTLSLVSLAILIISCLKSKDMPYEKIVAPEVEKVDTFKMPVYIVSFLAIWILIYNGVLTKIFPQIKEWGADHVMLMEVLLFGILFVMVLVLLRKELVRDFKLLMHNFVTYNNFVARGFFWIMVLNLATGVILNKIVHETSENQALLNEMPLWFMIIFGTFIGPMVEEGVYRGILGKFIKNKVVFVIISALLFAAMHVVTFTSLPETPLQYLFLIQYGVMGVVLAVNYKRTNNIFSSYIVHMLMNGTASILQALVLL